MKDLTKLGPSLLVALCVLTVVATVAPAMGSSVVQQFSFEEAVSGADLVVLGRVVETPDLAIRDSKRRINTHHTFEVEEYIKGNGPHELTVVTTGGKYWAETENGPVLRRVISTAPQLPAEGTEILLFLRNTDVGYAVYSASHSVVRVETDAEGRRTVRLLFNRLECMPPDVRKRAETLRSEGYELEGRQLIGVVPVSEVKHLARLALTPRP